jgi:hypothetical protein
MARNVSRDERGAGALCRERRGLLVEGSDFRALVVVQDGTRKRSGDMILGILRGRAGVDDRVELREHFRADRNRRFLRPFHR